MSDGGGDGGGGGEQWVGHTETESARAHRHQIHKKLSWASWSKPYHHYFTERCLRRVSFATISFIKKPVIKNERNEGLEASNSGNKAPKAST